MPGKNKVKRLERRRDRAQGKLDAINIEKNTDNSKLLTSTLKYFTDNPGADFFLKNNIKPYEKAIKDAGSKGAESIARMNQQAKDDLKYMPVDDRAATMKKGPIYKTEAREARDYAANAVYDTKHGKKSEAKFEKKKLMHIVNSIAGPRSRG
jgi:hypothetical protein